MDDKRLTTEEVGELVKPRRTSQTVRLWCKSKGLPHTKDKVSGALLISRYALKKWCKVHSVAMEEKA